MEVPYIDKVQAILQYFISHETFLLITGFILCFEDKKGFCFSFLKVNHKDRRVFSFQSHIFVWIIVIVLHDICSVLNFSILFCFVFVLLSYCVAFRKILQ